jgi:F-type H+-transporting ATPase subunit epsilon
MRLRIHTPLEVMVDDAEVRSVRAEDATGSFGILEGHEDFLTTLPVSVVTWSDIRGETCYCAVRGGVLTVTDGDAVAVATREAVVGTDLERLHRDVLARLEAAREAERSERFESTQLHLAAIREITRHLRQARRRESP